MTIMNQVIKATRVSCNVNSMREQLRCYIDETVSLQNHVRLLEEELDSYKSMEKDIDKYKKLDMSQKASIKKLKVENDNLKRELSKHRGMRKYVTSQTPSDSGDMSKLKNAKSKIKSLTAQLQQTTNELLAIAADDAGDDTADDVTSVSVSASPCLGSQRNRDSDDDFILVPRNKYRSKATQTPSSSMAASPSVRGRPAQDVHVSSATRQSSGCPDAQQSIPTIVGMRPTGRPNYAHVVKHRELNTQSINGDKTVIIGTSLMRNSSAALNQRGIDASGYAYPGAQIPLVRGRISSILCPSRQPDNIVLQCGGNDAERRDPVQIARQYESLIDTVRRTCPTSVIHVSKIPPRPRSENTNRSIKQVNAMLKDICTKKDMVEFIDICPTSRSEYRGDRVHFNKQGIASYANALATVLVNFQRRHCNQMV